MRDEHHEAMRRAVDLALSGQYSNWWSIAGRMRARGCLVSHLEWTPAQRQWLDQLCAEARGAERGARRIAGAGDLVGSLAADGVDVSPARRPLMMGPQRDVERALKLLIDTSEAIAVLFDDKYRLLYSSPSHRALLRIDASDLYGKPFQRFQSQSQVALLDSIGGPRGWFTNGVKSVEVMLLRRPFERARNPRASAQQGAAWTIRDGVDAPLVLGITHEIPIADYRPKPFTFTTFDDRTA
jgi:PAS domain-containing protein